MAPKKAVPPSRRKPESIIHHHHASADYHPLAVDIGAEPFEQGQERQRIKVQISFEIAGGLFQVVIGPGEVERVYAALREQTGLASSTIADVKKKSS